MQRPVRELAGTASRRIRGAVLLMTLIATQAGLAAEPGEPADHAALLAARWVGWLQKHADESPEAAVALEGYCPVALRENRRWVRGEPTIVLRHQGRDYRFASADDRQRFQRTPKDYALLLAGFDPVVAIEQTRWAPGKRRHGVRFNTSTILFESEASLQKFWKQPDRYMKIIDQALQFAEAADPQP